MCDFPSPESHTHFYLSRTRIPNDLQRWLELCECREIYRYNYDAIQRLPGLCITSRVLKDGSIRTFDLKTVPLAKFKMCSLVPLFDRVEAMIRNPVFQIMQQELPTIARYVIETKQKRHQALACLCQRLEAELMIDACGAVLESQHPNQPVQPIHDAMVVSTSFAPTAIEIIRSQFEKIGLKPHVKCEQITK